MYLFLRLCIVFIIAYARGRTDRESGVERKANCVSLGLLEEMIEGKTHPNAANRLFCLFPDDKCCEFQANSVAKLKLTASQKDAQRDYRLRVRRVRATALSGEKRRRNEAFTYELFFLITSYDGMASADRNTAHGFSDPHDIFHRTREHFPVAPWPVCAHASCARVGVFISNLPAGRAPRCRPRSGSYPMLSYQIML